MREKRPGDPVTVADTASERFLTERLSRLMPEAAVVGEEAVAEDQTVLTHLGAAGSVPRGRCRGVGAAGPVWIIDPIDGTVNFAQGRPGFTILTRN